MGVHINHGHANKRREYCRLTCVDLITLCLRDQKDFITGDWNQAGGYLEECCFYAVRTYEWRNNLPQGSIPWKIPGKKCEIRTIFFNWPINGKEYYMAVKELTRFAQYSTEDFGLRPTDTDAHVPQFSCSKSGLRIPLLLPNTKSFIHIPLKAKTRKGNDKSKRRRSLDELKQ